MSSSDGQTHKGKLLLKFMYANKKSSADPADDFYYPTIVRFEAAKQKAFPLGGNMQQRFPSF